MLSESFTQMSGFRRKNVTQIGYSPLGQHSTLLTSENLKIVQLKMNKKIISSFALAGIVSGLGAQTFVSGNITTNTTWGDLANPSPIIIDSGVFVKDGATLTILPGTIVRGQPRSDSDTTVPAGTPGSLIVTQTGRIIADGDATNPIIMTTAAVDNDNDGIPDDLNGDGLLDEFPGFDPAQLPAFVAMPQGDAVFFDDDPINAPLAPLDGNGNANISIWGGLVVLGNAPTNLANVAGVGYGKTTVEGLTVPGFPSEDATYGGVNPHDNSGILRYLSVRHAGDEIGNGNELNGITLAGVGDGTIIENCEVYCNFDDGFEWFGGTVNGKNLAVYFAGDDAFDLDEGYTGTNQFLFSIMPFFNRADGGNFGSGSGDKAGEFDGDNFRADNSQDNVNVRIDNLLQDIDGTAWPLSYPSMWNMTIFGSTPPAGDFDPAIEYPGGFPSTNRGIQFRNGFAGEVYNALIVNTGAETAWERANDVEKGVQVDVDGDAVFDFDGDVDANAAKGLISVVASSSFGGAALGAGEILVSNNGNALAARLGNASAVNRINEAGPFGFSFINGDVTFDPRGDASGKLVASLKSAPINPRPTGLGASFAIDSKGSQGVDSVSFRGAFDPTAQKLWTTGWSVLNTAGLLAD